jgi:hypothetical protein
MDSFEASTLYGDWGGTAEADDAHANSLHEYLKNKQLIKSTEFLIGAHLSINEGSPYVRAFVYEGKDFASVQAALVAQPDPIPVREIEINLSAEEFIGPFKQFSVMLMWKDLKIDGRDYSENSSLQ